MSWMGLNRQCHCRPDGATELKPCKAKDLASQLERRVVRELPGSAEDERPVELQCHSLERRLRYTAAEWVAVIERMSRYSQGSTPERPQLRPGNSTGGAIMAQSMEGREGERPVQKELVAKTAEYLATINLSSGPTWRYPLKTLPRPTGNATRVIITEYDLPRPETLPHDAAADADGMIWYNDFGSHVLGMLDPKTAKVVEYPLPITKPGAPLGSLDLVLDKQGNIWLGTMYQGSLAKFDRKTTTFQTRGSLTFKGERRSANRDGHARQSRRGRAGVDRWRQRIPGGCEDRRVEDC
jgi:streptogramin lyase